MMKRHIGVILLILISTIVAGAQTKDEAALKSLVKQMTDAQMAFDAAALDKIFTSDYIEISPAGEFDPREKVLGFYKPELRPNPHSIPDAALSDFSIRDYGKF